MKVVKAIDVCIAKGCKHIKLPARKYKTFIRIVFGKVYSKPGDSEIYKGARISRW